MAHAVPDDLFFAAMKTTRMPIVLTDPHRPDNPVIFCNDAFLQLTGYAEAEVLGRNCRFLQGPETDRDVVAQVARALAAQEEISVELVNHRKNGEAFWNALFISPVVDDSGELIYFFASQLDVSRRRAAEEAVLRAQRIEAVERLTGGIAHDFNNLLQVIIGYVDLLGGRVDQNDRGAQRAIEAISVSAQRGATLTQQLLSFARKQELRDQRVDLNLLIEGVRGTIGQTAGNMQVQVRLAKDLWCARIDPVQAQMAILNIVANAHDAAGDAGALTIATRNIVLSGTTAATAKIVPGDYVVITIEDDGPGIAPAVLDRIFDPFFSEKEVGKNTGLGLAMVHGFMRQSGGQVTASNRAEGGAMLSLYFPRAPGVAEEMSAGAAAPLHGEGRRILMVEDQPEVASLGQALLESQGFSVTQLPNARAALDLLERDADFELLFSDIVMPGGMNGVELARTVRRDYPKLRILLTTGYAEDAIDESARCFELLRKPYRSDDLGRRVALLLGTPASP